MNRGRGPITLLTDFGSEDGYVGAMKGVIASLAPGVPVVDICHAVPPQDLLHGGLVWSSAVPFFPGGSVHVAVVDPGVGTARRILAFRARGSVFLAPDNGMIGLVLSPRDVRKVVTVSDPSYFLPVVSSTFHGRDIFAPVAARLAAGLELEALGPVARAYRRETLPKPRRRRRQKERSVFEDHGRLIHIDRFGNAVTNLRLRRACRLKQFRAAKRHSFETLETAYGNVPQGEPLVLVGSLGFLEIAVNRGSAAHELGLCRGDAVVAVWQE